MQFQKHAEVQDSTEQLLHFGVPFLNRIKRYDNIHWWIMYYACIIILVLVINNNIIVKSKLDQKTFYGFNKVRILKMSSLI